MPLFEYFCKKCNQKHEKLLAEPLEENPCPHCGKPAKRVVSLFASGSPCVSPPGSGFG